MGLRRTRAGRARHRGRAGRRSSTSHADAARAGGGRRRARCDRRSPPGLPRSSRPPATRPTVRRRAVLALAPFDGPEVDAALETRSSGPRLAGPAGGRGPAAEDRSAIGLHEHHLAASRRTRCSGRRRARRTRAARRRGAPGSRLVGQALVEARQHAAAADEVDALQDEVLGQLGRRLPRHCTTESTMALTCSSMASRTSSGERMTVLGRPLISSRPRTSAFTSSRTGDAEPMAILISSAVRSPMAMPYSRRT